MATGLAGLVGGALLGAGYVASKKFGSRDDVEPEEPVESWKEKKPWIDDEP
jgi:hypothetical protein